MSLHLFSRGVNRAVGRKPCQMAARNFRDPGCRVLAIELLEARCLLSASLGLGAVSGTAGAKNLADLPVAAQHAISSAIGLDQEATFTASAGAAGDCFGVSASISGNTAVVGAYQVNKATGAAYVFTGAGSNWTQVATLTASDGAAGRLVRRLGFHQRHHAGGRDARGQ